jgi:hypothetical protein
MSLSNDVIDKRWVFRSQIDQSWIIHNSLAIDAKKAKTSKIVIDDEMKRKKREEEKSVNRNSRSTSHCTCSIERVIELEANKLDWTTNRDSFVDDRLQMRADFDFWWYISEFSLLKKRKEELMLSFETIRMKNSWIYCDERMMIVLFKTFFS